MNLLVVLYVFGPALMTLGAISATADAGLYDSQEDLVRAARYPADYGVGVPGDSMSNEGNQDEEKPSKLSRLIRQVTREKRLYESEEEKQEKYKKIYEAKTGKKYDSKCRADSMIYYPCVFDYRVICMGVRGSKEQFCWHSTYGSEGVGMTTQYNDKTGKDDKNVKCYTNDDCIRYHKNGFHKNGQK